MKIKSKGRATKQNVESFKNGVTTELEGMQQQLKRIGEKLQEHSDALKEVTKRNAELANEIHQLQGKAE